MKKQDEALFRNIVYGLRDPRNDVYQYIGKSTVGVSRPLSHLYSSHSDLVKAWVKELENMWLYPEIDIIETVEDITYLADREKYWIEYYSSINPNILNIQNRVTLELDPWTKKDQDKLNDAYAIISDLSEILKKARKSRNISQEEMSRDMGVSRSTLSLLERGKNVSFSTVTKYFLTIKGYDIIK